MPQAFQQLFSPHPIKKTQAYEDSWRRIVDVAPSRLTWDLLVKMFYDLDVIMFHGDLCRRVLFKWVEMRLLGDPGQLGLTQGPKDWRNERIKLMLASDLDWTQYPPGYALGVLLHEMLHAYFMVWCRHDTLETTFAPDNDGTHGVIFTEAAKRIEKKMLADLTSDPESFVDPMMPKGLPSFCAYSSMNHLG